MYRLISAYVAPSCIKWYYFHRYDESLSKTKVSLSLCVRACVCVCGSIWYLEPSAWFRRIYIWGKLKTASLVVVRVSLHSLVAFRWYAWWWYRTKFTRCDLCSRRVFELWAVAMYFYIDGFSRKVLPDISYLRCYVDTDHKYLEIKAMTVGENS